MEKTFYDSRNWWVEKSPIIDAVDRIDKNGEPFVTITIIRKFGENEKKWNVNCFDNFTAADVLALPKATFTGGMKEGFGICIIKYDA